jgi:hypothetical protein
MKRPSPCRARPRAGLGVEVLESRQLLHGSSLASPVFERPPMASPVHITREDGFSTRFVVERTRGFRAQDGRHHRDESAHRGDRRGDGFWEYVGTVRGVFVRWSYDVNNRGTDSLRSADGVEPQQLEPAATDSALPRDPVASPRVTPELSTESPQTDVAILASLLVLEGQPPQAAQVSGESDFIAPSAVEAGAPAVVTRAPVASQGPGGAGGLDGIDVQGTLHGTPRPAEAAPAPPDRPRGEDVAEAPKPNGVVTDLTFAPGVAGLLSDALPGGLAVLERALQALTEPEAETEARDSTVLHWLGLSAWVVGAGMAYEVARRRRQAPALAGVGCFRATGLPLEDLP